MLILVIASNFSLRHVEFFINISLSVTLPSRKHTILLDAEILLCILQLKRLKLRKNNWDCDTYQFDEVLTETASQKRVYEVVAKPVVEVGEA